MLLKNILAFVIPNASLFSFSNFEGIFAGEQNLDMIIFYYSNSHFHHCEYGQYFSSLWVWSMILTFALFIRKIVILYISNLFTLFA